MIIRKMLFASALIVSALSGHASDAPSTTGSKPSDSHITGHVVDTESGEHLPYYTIRLLGTNIGTQTDATGHYSMRNIKPGHYTVEAAMMGYATQKRDVDLKKGETAEINFDVTPDAFMLDQVVVTGSKSEQKRRNSPVLVSVINNYCCPIKLFEAKQN